MSHGCDLAGVDLVSARDGQSQRAQRVLEALFNEVPSSWEKSKKTGLVHCILA